MKINSIITKSGRYCLTALASILFFACGNDPVDTVDPSIPLEFTSDNSAVTISDGGRRATLEIPSLGGEVSFGIETEAKWSAQIDDDGKWVALTGSDGKITISGPEFVSDYVRRALVRIMSGNKPIGYIDVSQAGTEVAALSLDRTELVFSEMGGTGTITVETNRESWSIEGFDGKGWLEYSIEGDQVILTAIRNEVAHQFETTFTVVAGTDMNHRTADVSVTLKPWTPAYITLNRNMIILPEEGGNLSVAVESNREWKASTSDTWYTVSQEDGQIVINAAASTSGVLEGAITLETTSGRDAATLAVPIKQYTNPYTLEYTVPTDETRVAVPIGGVTNCYVDWGDGTSTSFAGRIEIGMSNPPAHEYATKGVYNVKIYGSAEKLTVGYSDDISSSVRYITAVKNWGDLGAKNLHYMLRQSSIKEIPAGYGDMFKNATQLDGAFWGCTQLEEIPADLLNDIKVTSVAACFFGCTKLKTIPGTLLKGATNITGVNTMFRECSSLLSIPEELFSECPKIQQFTATFSECSSLKTVPAGLFANNPEAWDMFALFRECTSLETIPASLFDNNKKVTNFTHSFLNCTKLTGDVPYTLSGEDKIYLWDRDGTNGYSLPNGNECFKGCTRLDDYANIPAGWK